LTGAEQQVKASIDQRPDPCKTSNLVQPEVVMYPLIEGLRPVAASTHRLPARDKAQIARLDDDALIINYVTEGTLYAEQHGRTVLLQPGDASVSDAAAPYFLAFDRPLGCVSVKVSRQEMLLRAGGIERLTAVSLSRASSLQPVVFGFLRQLIAEAPRLSPEAGSKAVAVFKELVAASLQEALRLPGAPPSEHGAVARQRIKAFIEAHLMDAALCPDSVARENG
jgi:hypothetical protein